MALQNIMDFEFGDIICVLIKKKLSLDNDLKYFSVFYLQCNYQGEATYYIESRFAFCKFESKIIVKVFCYFQGFINHWWAN